jgi:hypothetical protein
LSPRVEDEKLDSQTYEEVSSNRSVDTLSLVAGIQLIRLPKPNQSQEIEGWLAGNIPMKVGYPKQERME